MEKEINIESQGICINFFFEGFDFSPKQIKEYSNSLDWMAGAFSLFLKNELNISDYVFNLNITICDDQEIKDLNNTHRSKNKITDVLSFPLQENIRINAFDKFMPEVELGDLYICHSICQDQAHEFDLSFQDEFIHLSTHGFLHLCGFDHEISVSEEVIMEKHEESIIKQVSKIKKSKS